jgi:hypothetical protein
MLASSAARFLPRDREVEREPVSRICGGAREIGAANVSGVRVMNAGVSGVRVVNAGVKPELEDRTLEVTFAA